MVIEIDLLNIYVEELSAIDANLGEEQELATERQHLMQSDKVMQTLSEAQSLLDNNTPAAHLAKAERLLQNYGESLPEIASLLEELATAAATAAGRSDRYHHRGRGRTRHACHLQRGRP